MNEVSQEIGKRIRTWRLATPPPKTRRKRRGETGWRDHMTIEELANATGLTVTTVNKLELAYKSPRIESLLLLCNAFGCEPNDLLPKVRGRSSMKNELLKDLHAVASQMTPKKIRDLLAYARGEL